jgi:hypothetical protein
MDFELETLTNLTMTILKKLCQKKEEEEEEEGN